MERPESLDNNVFVKRIATVFRWYGKDHERGRQGAGQALRAER